MREVKLVVLGIIAIMLIAVLITYVKISLTGQWWVDAGDYYVQVSGGEGRNQYYSGSPPEVSELYPASWEKRPSSSYGERVNGYQYIIGNTKPMVIRERSYE